MKKILITGGNGRVGKDLCKYLSRDYEIIVLEKGNNIDDMKFNRSDAIIHLAALTPRPDKRYSLKEYIKTNVELTKSVLNYAMRNKKKIKVTILPSSWSWSFKIGDYQYSKLIQEKIADTYIKNGVNIVKLELPEVVTDDNKWILTRIIDKLQLGHNVTVDDIEITTITTQQIAETCKRLIDDCTEEGLKMFKDSLTTVNIYEETKKETERRFPDRISLLMKGIRKIRNIKVNKDETKEAITFPDFEFDDR